MGSHDRAIRPIKVMTTERTVAKIGRSMKKREIMADFLHSARVIRGSKNLASSEQRALGHRSQIGRVSASAPGRG